MNCIAAEHITFDYSLKSGRGLLLGHVLGIVCRVCKLTDVLRNAQVLRYKWHHTCGLNTADYSPITSSLIRFCSGFCTLRSVWLVIASISHMKYVLRATENVFHWNFKLLVA